MQSGREGLGRFLAAFVAAAILLIVGRGAAAAVQQLVPLAASSSPYWQPADGFLLYVVMPLVAVSGAVMILAPGLLLSLATLRAGHGFAGWVVRGYLFSALGLTAVGMALDRLRTTPVTGSRFVLLLLVLTVICGVIAWRANRAGRIRWGIFSGRRAELAFAVLLPMIALALFSPKFYWEDLNADGAHLYFSARALMENGLPVWFGNMGTPETYPPAIWLEVVNASLFLRLFDLPELAVRLPLILGLGLLFLVVMEFIRLGARTVPGKSVMLAVASVLLLFAYVLIYQVSYFPYYADAALPGGREPYVSVLFLGVVWFFLHRNTMAMIGSIIALCFSVPSAPLLVAGWVGAVFMVSQRRPWRPMLDAVLGLGIGMVLLKTVPWAMDQAGLMPLDSEFGAKSLLRRLRYVTLDEGHRALFWILPGGILPALALFAWKWQDRLGRALTLLVLGYAVFFQVQAYRVLPHHFSPLMILPMIIFWRLPAMMQFQRRVALMSLLAALLAADLSQPSEWRPFLGTRRFAARVDVSAVPPQNGACSPEEQVAYLLSSAFPTRFSEVDRYLGFRVSAPAVIRYLNWSEAPNLRTDYEIIPVQDTPASASAARIAGTQCLVLYARDLETYYKDRNAPYLWQGLENPFYQEPRDEVFGSGAQAGPDRVWDFLRLLDVFQG